MLPGLRSNLGARSALKSSRWLWAVACVLGIVVLGSRFPGGRGCPCQELRDSGASGPESGWVLGAVCPKLGWTPWDPPPPPALRPRQPGEMAPRGRRRREPPAEARGGHGAGAGGSCSPAGLGPAALLALGDGPQAQPRSGQRRAGTAVGLRVRLAVAGWAVRSAPSHPSAHGKQAPAFAGVAVTSRTGLIGRGWWDTGTGCPEQLWMP